jgi:RimJ/RimL family protein N-acetyltransferase
MRGLDPRIHLEKRIGKRHRPMTTQASEFFAYHAPALEAEEARHNLILAILDRAAREQAPDVRTWNLGTPGRCAAMSVGWPIVLGELDTPLCRQLAELTADIDYRGVVGPDLTAQWFAERATALGFAFLDPIRQGILALTGPPKYPGAPGHARPVTPDDASLFADWLMAFAAEATPHDPTPVRERLERAAGEGRHLFWVVDGEPVSVAGIGRRTRNAAAINGVYTPPALRGRGYAGSVTAAVVERAYAEGKAIACLYVDRRNPFSNRCYAKIGFEPVCASLHIPRHASADINR